MFHFPLAIVLTALPSATSEAKPVDERVDQLFAPWDKPGSPGAAVAVLKDGEVVVADGYGSAQLEHEIPITPETVFHVASVSKQFTAFAICLLAADGKLSLDDPIQKHVSEVPDFGHTITLKNLLHHTSGLRDQWESLAIGGWRLDDVITVQHVLTFVSHQRELNFEPGAQNMYCNTGYTLLAETVKRVSGVSFKEFCEQRIFEPLGMQNTHFHDDHEHVVPGRAYSYKGGGSGGFQNAVLSYANAGATSLFTTALDQLKWLENLGTGAVGGAEVQEMLRERYVLNDGTQGSYALGIAIGDRNGHTSISHSGGDAGFRSFIAWYPEQALGVVVLSNLGSFAPSRLADLVAKFYLPEVESAEDGETTAADESEGEPPDEEPEAAASEFIVLEDPILDRHVGSYLHESGMVIKVTRGEGVLVIHTDGEVIARATSETDFILDQGGVKVTFVPGADARSRAILADMGGTVSRLKRIEQQELDPLALSDYVGRYWSEELGTFYDLDVKDGALIARHRRHGTIGLTPGGRDRFRGDRWFFSRLEFQRREDEAVTGFRLQGGRVKNLLFERR